MLVVETIGRIRREHFIHGKSIKEIARDLRLSRNTVRKVLRSDETSFSYERQGLILAQGHTGQAPDPAISVTGYSEGRAGDRGVMRPRIVLKGVEQPRQFGEQALIRVLEGAAPMKRVGQELAVAIKLDTFQDRLGAGLERCKVRRDPIRRDLAVGVGGQDHAGPFSTFHKPGLGKVHRRAAGGASVRGLRRKSSFDDTDVKRPALSQSSNDARALIGAIVGEYDDADQPWRTGAPSRSRC